MYSQHTNSFAILAGMFGEQDEEIVAQKIISDTNLVQASLYFNFYVFQALKKAGFGDEVISAMDKWAFFLNKGFTTFPEHGLQSRSDCHAWSAHPLYDFLNITCGIESSSPGFKTVEIRPHPGYLSDINARIPHPLGDISIKILNDKTEGTKFRIVLPIGITGKLIYKQSTYSLKGGTNEFSLK